MMKLLPDEILLTIFECLDYTELFNCQKVCQYWYPLAHRILIQEVRLNSDKEIKKFIAFLDHKASQSYFNTVKTIRIDRNDYSFNLTLVLEREAIRKLFFRFPNLQNVYLDRLYLIENFDDDLCNTFLSNCPKLNTFDILDYDLMEDYGDLWKKVQPLLTHIRFCSFELNSNIRDPVQFITQCPRLRSLDCEEEDINSFAKFLPILEQSSNITKLHFTFQYDIEEDFDEKYFSVKPKETRDLILKRISNITSLSLTPYDNTINTLKFVSKYFTGLKYFSVERYYVEEEETDAEKDLFCKNTLDAMLSVKGNCDAQFSEMPFTCLSNNFRRLIQIMFPQAPQIYEESKGRVLELTVYSPHFEEPYVKLILNSTQSPFSRNVKIEADERIDLVSVMGLFKNNAPMNKIDVFKLHFTKKEEFGLYIDTATYLKLLETMPSLKEVQLDVPENFTETKPQAYDGPVFDQVEDVTITATEGGSFQSLLDSCYHAFPKLEHLSICNFSGLQRAHICEFQLDLPDYSLKKLSLDVHPVVQAINTKMPEFFVLEVEILDLNEQRFYVVASDLSICDDIEDLDAIRFKRRRDYVRVRLIVANVEQVVLFINKHYPHKSCTIDLDD